MSKIELAINSTQWKIEAQQKTIEEMRQSIKTSIDSDHLEYDVDFILGYARRMKEAADKLRELHETMRMLTYLKEEDN